MELSKLKSELPVSELPETEKGKHIREETKNKLIFFSALLNAVVYFELQHQIYIILFFLYLWIMQNTDLENMSDVHITQIHSIHVSQFSRVRA